MFNIFGILLSLLIAELTRGAGVLVGTESLIAACAAPAIVLLLGLGLSTFIRRKLRDFGDVARLGASLDPQDPRRPLLAAQLSRSRETFARRIPLLKLALDGVILALYFVLCSLFGWTDYVHRVLEIPQGLDVLPLLAPYFVMLTASWVGVYRIDHALRGPAWRWGKFAGFHLRMNLMTLLPVVLVNLLEWALRTQVPVAGNLMNSFEYLKVAAILLLVTVASVFLPLLVRWLLPAEPLPDGVLKQRLEALAGRCGVSVRRIYVWNTRSRHVATAFVIGLVPLFRYVFITDALLRLMDDDEIEAVYAHELGHVKHRHLWWLLVFLLTFTPVLLGLDALRILADLGDSWQVLPLAAAGIYGYTAFGYISRRFERQADFFAAQHTDPRLFAGVLHKLGVRFGHGLNRKGWRHFSLGRRIREVLLASEHPEVRPLFAAELRRSILAAAALTLVCSLALIPSVREDIITGRATWSLAELDRHRVEDRHDPKRLEELRARTVERAAAMAELDDSPDGDFHRIALWYEGVANTLAGAPTDAFDRLLAQASVERRQATSAEEAEKIGRWMRFVERGRRAAHDARAKGTPFWDELDTEP